MSAVSCVEQCSKNVALCVLYKTRLFHSGGNNEVFLSCQRFSAAYGSLWRRVVTNSAAPIEIMTETLVVSFTLITTEPAPGVRGHTGAGPYCKHPLCPRIQLKLLNTRDGFRYWRPK